MKVSVFGLGYVGAVSVACLAADGHSVVGVDVSPDKVAAIAGGRSPIVEPELADMLKEGVERGLISATTDVESAIRGSDVSLVSVGTPSGPDGALDLAFVFRVAEEIGAALAAKEGEHVVALRSTVPPGTTAAFADSVRMAGAGSGVSFAFNPEFLREGSAVRDYFAPAYTVIGSDDPRAQTALRELYSAIDAPVHVVEPGVAEMVKGVANAWHATKITFANEVGRLSAALGVDGRDVMGLIVKDSKLNISPVYLRPGFAYGGSCLPKDVASLVAQARTHNVQLPLLRSLDESNTETVRAAAAIVLRAGACRVAVLGLAFKPKTDDLRESPAVRLVKTLIGEGCDVSLFDPDVEHARLVGANLGYIRTHLPHFEALLRPSAADALEGADVCVITHGSPEYAEAVLATGTRRIVDLAGAFAEPPPDREFVGLAW